MSIVRVEDVSLVIGGKTILQNIDMQLDKAKIYGLIGRNGSGKTVLMKCICGFMHPTTGKIVVDGKVIGKECDFPQNTGVIIETPEFYPYYSGIHNLKNLAAIGGKISVARIKEVIREVGLNPESRLPVRKYSLGMRQRLGLAQAIMEDPDILILDEPMNGLDVDGVKDMREYLLKLKNKGTTILLASHSAEDIMLLCDETFTMEKGRMVHNIKKQD